MTRMLLFHDGIRKEIKEIIEYAHGHPLSYEDLQATCEGKLAAIGMRNPKHTLQLLVGYRVVYSEEYQR